MDEYDRMIDRIIEGAGPEIRTGPLYGHGVPHIDLTDFPFMEAVNRGEKDPVEQVSLDDLDDNDEPTEYTELIMNTAFIGKYPFNVILEGITNQFKDYIGTEDTTNYVDIFYLQLHDSMLAAKDDEEEHPAEIIDVLTRFQSEFITTMRRLFEQRLAIVVDEYKGDDDLEYIFKRLYEFFILKAKDNFKRVISRDINSKIKSVIEDDREFFNTIESLLRYYSPLVIAISPTEFLQLAGDETILEMFETGEVCGNFLRKYSPKLYQYEDYKVDIISTITMIHDVKEEINNARHDEHKPD